MTLIDYSGKIVKCIANNQVHTKGSYTNTIYADNLPNGVYYVQLRTDKEVPTKKLILLK